MLTLYNTLSRKKEAFKPLKGKEVRMYTCGPTVYDFAHVGNFRTYVFEDLLRRYLEFKGFKAKQVMNITDVDDKTIKGSQKEGIPLNQFTKRFEDGFFEDWKKLNLEKAEIYPRATEHIPEMVALVKKLLKKGFAYKGEDGSIYFSIKKFKNYGKLSHFKIKKLVAGKRVAQDEYEKDVAADFALWKHYTEEDGNVFWQTDLGKGRPGWHIECSAMSTKYLGESFDIHTGGIDNMFPHHENEIAQSEAASGKKFVKYWLHSAHLVVDGRKMAKSLGNFYTLRDLLQKGFSAKAIRYLLLSTHYRSQLNLTMDSLKAAEKTVQRFEEFLQRVKEANGKENAKVKAIILKAQKKFEDSMDDDLGISNALAAVFDFISEINKLIDANQISSNNAKEILNAMKSFDKVLGLLDFEEKKEELSSYLLELIKKREQLRAEKRFSEADEIRKQLEEKGIQLIDSDKGTKWKKTS